MRDRIEESLSFPKQLEPSQYRHIICFAPHPDDEVQGCGGYFKLATQSGSTVTVVVLTGGDPFGVGTSAQKLREQESLSASQIIGTNIIFEGLQDRTLRGAEWLSARIATHIRAANPDLICLPSPAEMHPDHQATLVAALAAAEQIGYLGDIGYYESGGVLNQPTHLVAIDLAIDVKKQALACFVSQELHQPYASRILARDHFRALTLGLNVQAAEAFEIFSFREKDQLKLFSHLPHLQVNATGRVISQREIPKVTVIVRAMGHPQLKTAIASILNQTLPAHEILIVHAAPTTNSADWIFSLSPCVRELKTSVNLSRARAANIGLEHASGEYAIFLDEDDHFLPSHLHSLVNAVQAQPKAVGALSQTLLVDGSGAHIKTLDYGYLPDRLLFHNLYPIHSILFRTAHVRDHQLKFDEGLEILEDWDFWIQVSRTAILVETGSATCVYVVTNRSGVGTSGDFQNLRHTKLIATWLQRLGSDAYLSPIAQIANRVLYLEDTHRELSTKLSRSEQSVFSSEQQAAHWTAKAAEITDRFLVYSEKVEAQISAVQIEQAKLLERISAETDRAHALDVQIDQYKQNIDILQQDVSAQKSVLEERERTLSALNASQLVMFEEELRKVKESNAIRALAYEEEIKKLTASLPLNQLLRPFRYVSASTPIKLMSKVTRKLINGSRYLLRGDLKGFNSRLREYFASRFHNSAPAFDTGVTVRILTTPHAKFVADLLQDDLALLGCRAEITHHFSSDDFDDNQFYFVLCAQMFNRLPPGNRRIIVQLEQLINTNWHSSSYFKDLEESLAVLEFSRTNLDVLAQHGLRYPHIFYFPLGPRFDGVSRAARAKSSFKLADFLFYGSWKPSARRSQVLDILDQEGFRTTRIDNIFGADLTSLLIKAKAIVNIHYDVKNMMEAPRIYECLSMGVPVISEPSSDSNDYVHLAPALTIAEEQTPFAMTKVLSNWEPPEIREIESPLKLAQAIHQFHFVRAMLACNLFNPSLDSIPYPLLEPMKPNVPVVLSLPETFQRRAAFTEQWPSEIHHVLFNGIRNRKGWIGCGLSYRTLARWALAEGLSQLIVVEDDVSLPPDFSEQFPRLLRFLDQVDQPWDVYCGLIAVLEEPVNCLKRYKPNDLGHDILLIDRFKSMVFNVFNKSSLEYLAAWDPSVGDEHTNTIDVYLDKKPGIRTLVSCPFLVGHSEDLHSTLWGIQNDAYNPMITATQIKLDQLIPIDPAL